MEGAVKGTVTSLSSIFPADEAHKAAQRVQDTIAQRQKELDQLREFIAENAALVSLVQKLPDELHHDIMVPFGKAAFFPGRLIHTNEFLVLLGENYYADRTSKQTMDILKRRGKSLESQVESLKAIMKDLKAEASFFDATAAEAAEGLVEIREDYVEEISTKNVSKAGHAKAGTHNFSNASNMKAVGEDEEYAQMITGIHKLEKEELTSESIVGGDEDEEYVRLMSRMDELEKEELEAESANECSEPGQTEAGFNHSLNQQSFDDCKNSEEHLLSNPLKLSKDEKTSKEESLGRSHIRHDLSDQLKFDDLKLQPLSEDISSHGKSIATAMSNSAEKAPVILPEGKENVQVAATSKNEVFVRNFERGASSHEAFTGSIVEHTHGLEKKTNQNTTASKSTSETSKPVSRFKMQRK